MQGFILDGENLIMSAYALDFSLDGSNWYNFVYKTGSKVRDVALFYYYFTRFLWFSFWNYVYTLYFVCW